VGGRRIGRWWWLGYAATTLLTAMAALWAGSPATASLPPLDGGPSSDGMPGGPFIGQLIGWGKWLGLAACGLAFIYGAATWRGWGSQSSARAADGKGWVISGAIGAALIGLVGFIIPMVYGAASS
jgi:hypothetical protein